MCFFLKKNIFLVVLNYQDQEKRSQEGAVNTPGLQGLRIHVLPVATWAPSSAVPSSGNGGAVQAGTAKFLLLLGNRTDPTVNMGNEGFVCVCQSRFNFLLNAEALASLSSAPRSNFGRGVAVKVTARGEVSSSVDL